VLSRSLPLMIVVLFEGDLGGRLARWRRSYDPLGADRIPPHLTLVSPFPAQPPLPLLERRLWAVCHASPPVWLELGDVARDGGLLYVEVVSGGPELARLREALYAGPLSGPAEDADAFRPRIVLAEPASETELAAASKQLVGLQVRASYEVKGVHLLAAHADGSWYVRDFFGLDGAYSARPEAAPPARTG
jgi:hypothetical protein